MIVNLQFRKCSFQISKYCTLTLALRTVLKFEPDHRTPTSLAFRENTFDPSPYFFITLRSEEMKSYRLFSPDSRRGLKIS